jgi:hypothetical protein
LSHSGGKKTYHGLLLVLLAVSWAVVEIVVWWLHVSVSKKCQ